MGIFEYEGRTAREISFPLGGIGTGCIGLAGNGAFIEPEIFNAPNKCAEGGYTHFAVKAENDAGVVAARALMSDLMPPYSGTPERGFGFGPDRTSMNGIPHFAASRFIGKFPIARVLFDEDCFPAHVELTALNPFIPSNDFDSSLPGAMFELTFTNTSREALAFTAALTVSDFYANAARASTSHAFSRENGYPCLFMRPEIDPSACEYGDIAVSVDAPEAFCQRYWHRGRWFDDLSMWWHDFTSFGALKDREYAPFAPRVYSTRDAGTLCGRARLKPGESAKMRFVLAWNCPNVRRSWGVSAPGLSPAEKERISQRKWKNWYATKFPSSLETAKYIMGDFSRLLDETERFQGALYASSLPPAALEAVTANLSVLKSPTCLRLEDGSFYAFEGCSPHVGSCEGSCTHVWSYAYAPAYLFPALERSARTLEYERSVDEHGQMGFRLQLPPDEKKTNFRACVDGQYGTVMRVWREYALSGNKAWLSKIWESVKRTIAFAWSKENPDGWDLDMDGVMEGRQHHTLDMELYGPSSWLTSMYLGGLKAGIALARAMSDDEARAQYEVIFEKGRRALNETLFNGEYFYQKIELTDKRLLEQKSDAPSLFGQSAVDAYWNEETGELKYQSGEGCLLDQILGQWHADLLELGDIADPEKAKSALSAIYKHNYVDCMRDFCNPCRIFSLGDEQGLTICAYPEGRRRPILPIPYAEETMTGFEYQAASHMIMRGLEKEGLQCASAIRERYDGEKRNPYNELECGSNYARSMASYALLLAYSGFRCDRSQNRFALRPLHPGRYFWAVDGAWGQFTTQAECVEIEALYGSVPVRRLALSFPAASARLNGEEIAVAREGGDTVLARDAVLKAGKSLILRA